MRTHVINVMCIILHVHVHVQVHHACHVCMLHSLGMKYRYAKQWGIHCVSAQWFHDSVEAGYSMPEVDYDVDREQGGEAGEKEDGNEGETARGTGRKRYVQLIMTNGYHPLLQCVLLFLKFTVRLSLS